MKFAAAASCFTAMMAVATAADVPSLTANNYMELTNGKTVFLKFFIPSVSCCVVSTCFGQPPHAAATERQASSFNEEKI